MVAMSVVERVALLVERMVVYLAVWYVENLVLYLVAAKASATAEM